MNFWKKTEPYVYTWESEPFAFQKGMIYVIQVDTGSIREADVAKLNRFFYDQGVIVALVPTKGGKALNPITVKRKKETGDDQTVK